MLRCAGGRLVYKPRSLAIDIALYEVVAMLRSQHPDASSIWVPRSLDCEDHGWANPWQGAYSRDDGHSCFAHRSAQMLIRHTAVLGHRSTAPLREHARQWAQTSRDTLAAHANGHVYQGYADQTLPNWQAAYYGDRYARLQCVKRRYDPENLFRHTQSIAPGRTSMVVVGFGAGDDFP